MTLLKHWWTHSLLASMLVPAGFSLWNRRLKPQHEEHEAEMDEIRSERQRLERELEDLNRTGVMEATERVSEVARSIS